MCVIVIETLCHHKNKHKKNNLFDRTELSRQTKMNDEQKRKAEENDERIKEKKNSMYLL